MPRTGVPLTDDQAAELARLHAEVAAARNSPALAAARARLAALVVELRGQQILPADIARALDVSRSTITRMISESGQRFDPLPTKVRSLTSFELVRLHSAYAAVQAAEQRVTDAEQARDDRVRELARAGVLPIRIAEAMHVHRITVHTILRPKSDR